MLKSLAICACFYQSTYTAPYSGERSMWTCQIVEHLTRVEHIVAWQFESALRLLSDDRQPIFSACNF
jgi:hypothetical protein